MGSSPLVLVCASANPGKVAELSDALASVDAVELVPRPAAVPDVVEDADTLEGNARLKARAIAAATGRPAVADDTGLEVVALGGRPGVHTGRFAGEGCTDADNRARLLAELDGVSDRRARFRTVLLVAWPDGRRDGHEVLVEGVCDGEIATAERGDRGFGYDSVFVPADGDGRTFAQMTLAEKQAVSHRARALRALLPELSAAIGRFGGSVADG